MWIHAFVVVVVGVLAWKFYVVEKKKKGVLCVLGVVGENQNAGSGRRRYRG